VSYLVDTNVLSELRKGRRANPNVSMWFAGVGGEELWLSVLVIGEIRKGIENIRRRDQAAATNLDAWLDELLSEHADRIIDIDQRISDVWGRFNSPNPLPTVDSLLAATAHVHGLTVVTRNTDDVARTGVPCLNPFE
jgi:toxin FitB